MTSSGVLLSLEALQSAAAAPKWSEGASVVVAKLNSGCEVALYVVSNNEGKVFSKATV